MIHILGHDCIHNLILGLSSGTDSGSYADILVQYKSCNLDSLPVYATHDFSVSAPQDYQLCCDDFGYQLERVSYSRLSGLTPSDCLSLMRDFAWDTVPVEDRLRESWTYINDWYPRLFKDRYSLDEYKRYLGSL